ncbi:MAG: tetratricopeptide repeat protein [Acidobacteriia bacterium]|jgi:tetratricopeptide (TPR) repeat protein|nr:tetratricopeptide repeat protein [Terriglobia bacterium]
MRFLRCLPQALLACPVLAFFVLWVMTVAPVSAQERPLGQFVDLHVRVYDQQAESPVDRARVELLRFPDGVLALAFTDGTGRVSFPRLVPSSYWVRVQAEGYHRVEVNVDIRRGDYSRDVSVPLTRIQPLPATPSGQAISLRMLSLPDGAVKAFRRGLESLQTKKKPLESLEHFRQAIREAPEYYEAYFMLGTAYWELRRNSEAETAFRKALELNPNYLYPYYPLAVLLTAQRRFDEAEQLLRRAMELDPDGWQWPFEMARCLVGRNNWVQALEYAELARSKSNAPPKVHLLLADLYSGLGQNEKAIEALETYLRLEPQGPYAAQADKALADLRRRN